MSDKAMRLLHNAIVVVCCTVLAVAFDTWPLIWLTIWFWSFRRKD